MLSTLCFLGMSAVLPDAAFEAWGWRVPFLVGVALVGIGLVIRSKIPETEDMIDLKQHASQAKVPLATLLRTRAVSLLLCAVAFVAHAFYFYAAYTFGVAYGTDTIGYSYNALLGATLLFSFVYLLSILFSGWLSDRVGRKRVMYIGYAATFLTMIPFFAMLSSGSMTVVVLGFIMAGVANGFMYGPYAALLCEAFEARVRYTGISLGLTIGGVLGSAFSPMLFTELFRVTGSWLPVAVCVMIAAILSAGAVAALRKVSGAVSAPLGSFDDVRAQSAESAVEAARP